MDNWKLLVLAVGMLVLASEGSTDQLPTLKTPDALELAFAMSNISEALMCFGDIQNHSLQFCKRNHDTMNSLREFLATSLQAQNNVLNDFKDSVRDSLRLVGENCDCSKSLENITEVKVETLTEETEDLKRQLTAKDEEVEALTHDTENLNSQLADQKKTVETLTQENADLKTQLAAKDKEVQSLTLNIENSKRVYEEKEKKIKAGYEYIPGFGFYKLFLQAQTWADAVRLCSYDGAHLGIINSEEEARIYIKMVANHPKISGDAYHFYFFVGISEIDNTRQFKTLDGTPLSQAGYSKWESGEPNGRHENCVSITHEAKLNDFPCSMKLAYICESEYP